MARENAELRSIVEALLEAHIMRMAHDNAWWDECVICYADEGKPHDDDCPYGMALKWKAAQ